MSRAVAGRTQCSCKDFAKAPGNFCKHRLSAAIYKRATTLTKQRLEAQLDGNRTVYQATAQPAEAPKAAAPATSPLPEAPASCNVYVSIGGRKVQLTLRDSDEQRLLARLEQLLQRFPAADAAAPESPEGWCSKHGTQMTRHSNAKGSWWSHHLDTGKWCHGNGK
jgi:hypothetical protein